MGKQKLVLLFMLLTFVFLICGCVIERNSQENEMDISTIDTRYKENESVSLSLKEGNQLSEPLPDYITLVYFNLSNEKSFTYGAHFWLEKKLKNEWYLLPEMFAVDIDYTLLPQSSGEVRMYIESYHEQMDNGQYRFICLINNSSIVICEFTVESKDNM